MSSQETIVEKAKPENIKESQDTITNINAVFEKFHHIIKEWIKEVAEEHTFAIKDIIIPTDIAKDDLKDFNKLIRSGIPLYVAMFAFAYQNSYDLMTKKGKSKEYSLTEMKRYLFADLVLFATQGKTLASELPFIPNILKSVYKINPTIELARKFLYGENGGSMNMDILLQLVDSLNVGKIGQRLGLGMAGQRHYKAIAMGYYPNELPNNIKEIILICRTMTLGAIGSALHPARRSLQFGSIFGSINKVSMFILTRYCEPETYKYIKNSSMIYSKIQDETTVPQVIVWNKDAVFDYIDNVLKRGGTLKAKLGQLYNELEPKFRDRQFELTRDLQRSVDQRSGPSRGQSGTGDSVAFDLPSLAPSSD